LAGWQPPTGTNGVQNPVEDRGGFLVVEQNLPEALGRLSRLAQRPSLPQAMARYRRSWATEGIGTKS